MAKPNLPALPKRKKEQNQNLSLPAQKQQIANSTESFYQKNLNAWLNGSSQTAKTRYPAFEYKAQTAPQDLASYLTGSQMYRPERGKVLDFDYDAARQARIDNQVITDNLVKLGYFNTADNLYGDKAHLTTQEFRDSEKTRVLNQLGLSKQEDAKYQAQLDAYTDPNANGLRNWLAVRQSEGMDVANPTDEDLLAFDRLVNGNELRAFDYGSAEGVAYQNKVLDQWRNTDFDVLASEQPQKPAEYKSMTGTYQAQLDAIEAENNRVARVAELAQSATASPTFAQMSVYNDTASDGSTGNAFVDFWNAPRYAAVGKYEDKGYFINNAIPYASQALATDHSMAVQAYLNAGLNMLTPEEKTIYNYYINSGDEESANEYLDILSPQLLQRRADVMNAQTEVLSENSWTAAPMFVAAGLARAGSGIISPVVAAATATGLVENDPNAAWNDWQQFNRTVGTTQKGILAELGGPEIFGQNLYNLAYDGLNGLLDLGIAVGAGTALGNGVNAAKTITGLMQGSQAFSGAMYQAAERGLSGMEGVMQGMLAATIEGLTEKFSLDALFDNPVGGLKYVLRNSAIEASEEVVSAALDPVADGFMAYVFDHKTQLQEERDALLAMNVPMAEADAIVMNNLMEEIISSGLIGGFVGGTFSTGYASAQSRANRSTGQNIQQNAGLNQVVDIGLGMGEGSKSNSLARALKADLDANKRVNLGKVGRLANALESELGNAYTDAISSVADEAIVDRMVELGDEKQDARAVVGAIKKVAFGTGELTSEERSALAGTKSATKVVAELAGEDSDAEWIDKASDKTAEAVRPVKKKQKQLREAVYGVEPSSDVKAAAKEAARLTGGKEGPKSTWTKTSIAFDDDAGKNNGDVVRFEENKHGALDIVVKTSEGEKTISHDQITSADGSGVAKVLAYANQNKTRMSAEEANELLATYEAVGGNAEAFIDEYRGAFDAGYYGGAKPTARTLGEGLVARAYEAGMETQKKADAARFQRALKGGSAGSGAVTFLGQVESNEQVTGVGSEQALKEATKSMTASQRSAVEGVKAVARASGVNVVLFDSTQKGRSAGVQNGSFNARTNTIYIDINAGVSTQKGMQSARDAGTLGYAMLRTMSHELTHFIEANSADGYAALKRQAKLEFELKGKNWADLVNAKIKSSAAAGERLTRYGAEAEVIADACEMMLQDTTAIERMAKQDPSLKDKIVGFIRSFLDKVRKALNSIGAGSQEAKALMEMRDGLMRYTNELQKLWDDAFVEAAGNASVEQQADELSDANTAFSIREEAPPKKTGIAYKVFFEKNGKLYPPMVANPGGADTPVGVWLNADVGTSAPPSKTGRLQVKAGGKGTQGGSGSLAFRPGWHLGDIPKATQFNRLNKATGVKELFPYNFVWAECEYAMDVDYQEEAMSYGYNANGKFQHSLAGLPKLPVDGYYHYRTNPDPNTVPWVITGAMKVNKILSRAEVDEILREKGVEPTKWQGPDGEQMEADVGKAQSGAETTEVTGKQYAMRDASGNEFSITQREIEENKHLVANAKPVVTLNGNPFAKNPNKDFKEMAYDYLGDNGIDAYNPVLGTINIGMDGIEHLIAFITSRRSALLPAVKPVIEQGHIINIDKDHKAYGFDTAVIAGVVSLNGRDYYMGVAVKENNDGTNGYYVHDAVLVEKKSLLPNKSGLDTAGEKAPTLAIILSDLANYNREFAGDAQKSIRDDVDASADGTDIDTNTDSAYQQYSIRTWAASDYVTRREEAIDRLVNTLHVDREKAAKWIDDVNSISAIILDNKARLDYIPTAVEGVSAFKSNPEYGGSIDMSTICAKRRLATGTLDAIQRALGDAVLTKDDFLHIREMMKERKYEVACGLCFVESSRKNLSKYTKQFLDQFNATHPDNQVSMTDFNTVDGLERVRLLNQEAYSEYEKFMNKLAQRKPKLFEKRTEYRHEVLQKFKKDTTVGAKNLNGGLRLQSFSDFEIVHLIDMMQVITDMASVGLAGQAYTKVPEFAWALGDTGLKINLSLIAKGVDEDGNLIFDDVEGMNHEEAKRLRDAYSENVGTIVVAFTDEQIMAAMKSDFVDFIIPFHRSQWQKSDYKKLGLPEGTKDYTMHQNEKQGRKRVKDNYLPNDYWKPNLSGKENAEYYLKKCTADGRTPKFAKFLQNNGDGTYDLKADGSTDGYWKLLIDFKMYDNDGNFSPQNPVQPNFNMDEAKRMLDAYNGIHDSFPVAQDVVDDFVAEYTGSRGGVKVGNGRVTIDNVQKSQRLPDDISAREYLADADNSIAATAEQANALEIYKTRIAAYREATQAVDQAKAALAATTDRDESIKAKNRLDILQKQQSRAYDQLIAAEGTKHIRELAGATTEFIQQQLAGKTEADIASMISEAESEIASLTEQLDGLKGASREQTEFVKEQIRMLKARVTRLRNSATRKLLETREHYQEMFQRDRTRREINAEAAKKASHIKDVVKRLDDRIRHETDYHNVKEDMKPAVRKLVETFLDGFGNLVFDQSKADRLLSVYQQLDNMDSEEGAFYSDDVESMLKDLSALAEEDAERRAAGGSLMDNAETKLAIYSQVADIADNIWHMVQMADEVFIEGKRASFGRLSENTGKDMLAQKDYRNLYGKLGKAQQFAEDLIRRGNMIPTYFFESLKNSGMQKLFDNVMNGQTKYAQVILDGQQKMQEAKRKYNYAAWAGNKPVEYETAQKHKIQLTTEQMMWVYATAKRERSNELAATSHLAQGGFKYEGEVKKGKIWADTDKPHRLNDADVNNITNMLTSEQKAYADELVEYLSTDMAEVGNEASMEMFGIRKYQEQYYFPFKTASEQRYQKSDAGSTSTTNDSRVKHSSFTHRLTRHANTTLVMGDFSDIIADHINQMATYASFMNPIESMNRVLNYKIEEADGTQSTIRSLVGRKYGDAALRYVQDFMKDINGGVQTDSRGMGAINTLIGAFKRGAVAASLSVAVQQPTAYVRAFAYMNPKYFFHGTGVGVKEAWAEAMQYSGTAVVKDMGKFDVGLGQTAKDWISEEDEGEFSLWERAKRYIPKVAEWKTVKTHWGNMMTALPGFMDQLTWSHIWKAVKAEQAELHPGMDVNSEAFLQMCGKRFDYIINHTQVYDSVLSKSNLMRSKNALNKMATSFMSEPTLTANLMYSAFKGDHTGAERSKMIATAIASNILAAAFAAAISAWNKDDDERTAPEKYLSKFAELAVDNLNPLGMLPYLSDISSMLDGYDVERVDMSVIKDVFEYSQDFFKTIFEDKTVPEWRQWENFTGTLLNLIGLPAKNISRDVRRIRNLVQTKFETPSPSTIGYSVLESAVPYGWYSSTKKAYYERYVNAVLNSDNQKAYNIKDFMTTSKGTSSNAWTEGVRAVIKNLVAEGKMTATQATEFLRKHAPYKNDKDNINKPKEWAGNN